MLLTLALAGSLLSMSQDPQLPPVEMGKAQLVFLIKTDHASALSEEAVEKLHSEHLTKLESLWQSRKVLVAGPVTDAGKRVEIVLLDVKDEAEAQSVLKDDPLVSAGHLRAECHTWYFAKNYVKKGKQFSDLGSYWFGTLDRPEHPPEVPAAQLSEMQQGHMENIQKMAQVGALLLAGPMEENTPFRGVFVFKGVDKRLIDELIAADPLIKAGRLKLSLSKWNVPKGSFLIERK